MSQNMLPAALFLDSFTLFSFIEAKARTLTLNVS